MKVYTTQEVSGVLSVTEYSVRKWAREGVLQGSRLGKEWRFQEEDIQAFLEAHRPKPAPGKSG